MQTAQRPAASSDQWPSEERSSPSPAWCCSASFALPAPVGRLIRAVADDKEAAQLAGADYRHVFGIAAALAFGTVALAGIAYGMYSQLSPTTGTDTILLFAFAAVVIGGLGSLWGTLLGGVVLGVAQQIGAQINISNEVLAGYIVFLAVIALRPPGLTSRGRSREPGHEHLARPAESSRSGHAKRGLARRHHPPCVPPAVPTAPRGPLTERVLWRGDRYRPSEPGLVPGE